jgi:hypothetical protein
MYLNVAFLSDAESAIGSLIFYGRIPPTIRYEKRD